MEGATRNGQSIDTGSIAHKETKLIPNIISDIKLFGGDNRLYKRQLL
jgi:hypothetical protein